MEYTAVMFLTQKRLINSELKCGDHASPFPHH